MTKKIYEHPHGDLATENSDGSISLLLKAETELDKHVNDHVSVNDAIGLAGQGKTAEDARLSLKEIISAFLAIRVEIGDIHSIFQRGDKEKDLIPWQESEKNEDEIAALQEKFRQKHEDIIEVVIAAKNN